MVLQAPGPDGYQWASSFLAKSCTQSMLAWEWGSQNKKLLGVCLMPLWVDNWGILFSCQRWSMASGIEQKKTEVELTGSVSACHLWELLLCPQTRKKNSWAWEYIPEISGLWRLGGRDAAGRGGDGCLRPRWGPELPYLRNLKTKAGRRDDSADKIIALGYLNKACSWGLLATHWPSRMSKLEVN